MKSWISPGRLQTSMGWFCLLFICSFSHGQIQESSSVWKVSKQGAYFYLAGTMHLLKKEDYPLPAVFDVAYDDADTIILETDLAELQKPRFQQQLTAAAQYPGGKTLRSVLSKEAFNALELYCHRRQLPIESFASMRVGLVVVTITMVELSALGLNQSGVDAFYFARALADRKKVLGLEEASQQIRYLVDMGLGIESDFLLRSLTEINHMAEDVDVLRKSWRSGDLSQLYSLMVEPMSQSAPQLYQQLLKQRNINWLKRLQDLNANEDIEMVLVGAAHLVGEHGLISLLQQKGFSIDRVKLDREIGKK